MVWSKFAHPDRQSTSLVDEYFRVSHYNPATDRFDGATELIRIPQQVTDRRGITPSTPNQIETSNAGNEGWYIFGALDKNGIFTVSALAPRSLFQLQPLKTILGKEAALHYIKEQNWLISEKDKGTFNSILLDPEATETQQALSQWQLGDRAIAIHLFGSIGGKKAETNLPGTVTGHLSLALAEVVRDPNTNKLQFAINYQQIYAHNPDGIIAGTHTWANYMGNLQWGWMHTRPVVDILIKFDPITQDYNFGGIKLSPLQELLQQLQVMQARYRLGDGTGGATVSIATSCVQDSMQALYTTIKAIKHRVSQEQEIQKWLSTHPNDPQTLRFNKLVNLSSTVSRQLTPLGIVRADWDSNPSLLTGIEKDKQPFQSRGIFAALTTWRTMLPRQAQDELAVALLRHGAKLWLLQTYQVGGYDPNIAPVAPTVILGRWTIPYTNIAPYPILLGRILSSFAPPNTRDVTIGIAILFIYATIALPIGFRTGFLRYQLGTTKRSRFISVMLLSLITPGIVEELFFRVLLLPHPMQVINWDIWIYWAVFSLTLFIIYHPVNAKTFFRSGDPTFRDPTFLVLAALLGIACTITYALTGCLWAIAFIHWIVVAVWLLLLGGLPRIYSK